MPVVFAFILKYKAWLIGCSIVTFLGLLLMGAPGALLIEAFNRSAGLFGKKVSIDDYGSQAWGLAIYYAVSIPWIVFGFALLFNKFLPALSGRSCAALSIIAGLIALFAVHTFIASPKVLKVEQQELQKNK